MQAETIENSNDISFNDLNIDSKILKAFENLGYTKPSTIQAAAIPAFLTGKDLIGLAQTGTGKTAAYGAPMLSMLDENDKRVQTLVLTPTRELAIQVSSALEQFAEFKPHINLATIYGGQDYSRQISAIKRGAQVVVGTPGRVIDHIKRGTLKLADVQMLILDEADEMLTMGFQEDVEFILDNLPEDIQIGLFSATMPPAIRKLTKKYLTDPIEVAIKSETKTTTNVSQSFVIVDRRDKFNALVRTLEAYDYDAAIIFARTKQATDDIAKDLNNLGFSAAAINGDLPQAKREKTINQLKNGEIDILVATDVAARGLDVPRISYVFNYDIPQDNQTYIHRIGRTGRAGRTGSTLLFVSKRDLGILRSIEKTTNQKMSEVPLPSIKDINANRALKFKNEVKSFLNDDSTAIFKPLLDEIKTETDVSGDDLAAAVAGLLYKDKRFYLSESKQDRQKSTWQPTDMSSVSASGGAGRKNRGGGNFTLYKIQVGSSKGVGPKQILGAIANEGGLSKNDFGHITIFKNYSEVELGSNVGKNVLSKLKNTKINGANIDIAPARTSSKFGRNNGRDRDSRSGGRGGRGFRRR